jgi:hypothetical protein
MRIPVMIAVGVLLASTPALVSTPALAQTQLSTWSVDQRTGCKVWNIAPQVNETISWSGACRNGVGEGRGVLQWFEGGQPGDRYEGELHDGKQTGHGVITSADGRSYDGDFRDGTMSGHGLYTDTSGDRYDGEWRNGKPNGVGRFVSAMRGTFDGYWTNGCFKDGTRRAAVIVALSTCP